MFEALINIEELICKIYGSGIVNVKEDKECPDYFGCKFQLGSQYVKFRKTRVTPKKIGQFVTLWKRDRNGQPVPYDLGDDFDFYIIPSEHTHQSGLFIFPKELLARMGILTSEVKEGKRGFRLYPDWDIPVNSQRIKTKKWQMEYFIKIDNEGKRVCYQGI